VQFFSPRKDDFYLSIVTVSPVSCPLTMLWSFRRDALVTASDQALVRWHSCSLS
jgi:hypothetical protein